MIKVFHVFLLKAVAAVVDALFGLYVGADAHILPVTCKSCVHAVKCHVKEREHFLYAGFKLAGESNLLVQFAFQDTGQVEIGVSKGFKLGDSPEHAADLVLCVVGEVGVSNGTQVFTNLVLHLVAHFFGLLDAVEEGCKGFFILDDIKLLHKAEHTLHLLSKDHNLLLGLENGEFRSLHQAAADILKAEFVFFIGFTGFDDKAHHFLNLGNKPYEDSRIYHVEAGMEGCKGKGELRGALLRGSRIHSHNAAHHPHKREE